MTGCCEKCGEIRRAARVLAKFFRETAGSGDLADFPEEYAAYKQALGYPDRISDKVLMGTRADFYVGRGETAEWLGSIAWDGYPDGIPAPLMEAISETDFRERVERILLADESATRPEMGWPWPWKDSRRTDYAYAWDDEVRIASFGYRWKTATERRTSDAQENSEGPSDKECVFPDMTERKNVTYGPRSGVLLAVLVSGRRDEEKDES